MKKVFPLLFTLLCVCMVSSSQAQMSISPNKGYRNFNNNVTVTGNTTLMLNATTTGNPNDVYITRPNNTYPIVGGSMNYGYMGFSYMTFGQLTIPVTADTGYYTLVMQVMDTVTNTIRVDSLQNAFYVYAGHICGTVFLDANTNGIYTYWNEPLIGGQTVLLLPDSLVAVTSGGSNYIPGNAPANYEFFVNDIVTNPNKIIYCQTQSGYFAVTNDSIPVNFSASNYYFNGQNFGEFTIPNGYNIVTSNSVNRRCLVNNTFVVTIHNTGVQLTTVKVKYVYSSNLTYLPGSVPGATVVGDSIFFNTGYMNYYSTKTYGPIFTKPAAGATIWIKVYYTGYNGTTVVYQDSSYVSKVVNCSYDPNLKEVLPVGVGPQHLTLKSEPYLDYTIHFENIGNGPAYTVAVNDQLSPNLNYASFQLVDSYSPNNLTTTLSNTGYLQFVFNNITLGPNQSGYVRYRIAPKTGLADSTVINNFATIIFDSNAPINTDTVSNMLVTVIKSVAMTSPNGGEQINPCGAYTITWNDLFPTNVAGTYNLYYSTNSGTTWNTIATNYATTTATYNWTIPTNLNGSSFRIKIENASNPMDNDISDTDFSIQSSVLNAGNDTLVCSGSTLQLNATPGFSTYSWAPASAVSNATVANPTMLANNSTTLVLTATAGSCTYNDTMSVNISGGALTPSVTISTPNTTICSGTSTQFTASAVNGGTASYNWMINGSPVGTNASTFTTSSLANNDSVTCLMTSSLACVSTSTALSNTVNMSVNPSTTPSVLIQASQNSVCTGTNVTFTATSVNGGTPSYNWMVNGVAIGNTTSTFSSTTLANGDIVTCDMSSSLACVSASTVTSNPITMTFGTPVTPSVSISPNPVTACAGSTVQFTATPVNGGSSPSYQWKLNGNNVGTNSAVYSNNTLNNGDIVAVFLTSNAACTSVSSIGSAPVAVTVIPNGQSASIAITASSSGAVCAGTAITFTAAITNGGTTPTYQWQVNGSNVGTNAATYSSSSLNNADMVKCILTSNQQCITAPTVNSNTITAAITTAPSLTGITSNGPICEFQNLNLSTTAVAGATYTWSGPNGFTATSANSTITSASAAASGAYAVYATLNGCTGNTVNSTVTVHQLPAQPIITANGNVLSTTVSGSLSWSFNGSPIAGANGSSYTATLSGNYSVSVTDNNTCSNSSLPFAFTAIGINAVIPANEIHLYPNPVDTKLEVTLQLNAATLLHTSLKLYNLIGDKLMQIDQPLSKQELDLSQLPAGHYLLKVECPEFSRTFKVTKH